MNLSFHLSPLARSFRIPIILLVMTSAIVCGGDDLDEINLNGRTLFELSLEELTKVKIRVPGAITKLSLAASPASVTVITADDIQRTPVRNIYDLLEVYVPGALWMNHNEGPLIGIRGIIIDRNYKYLLLVNGRNLNEKSHSGVKSELNQWNLDDIKKIEIIRGPGSVTYGPGAVGGVINIITHNADSSPGTKVTSQYVNRYDSFGISASHGMELGEDHKLYLFTSYVRTPGFDSLRHFIARNNGSAGFHGDSEIPGTEAQDYFWDFEDNPQLKVHAQYDLGRNWKFWTRYTQAGSTYFANRPKTTFQGKNLNLAAQRTRQLTLAVEFEKQLSEKFELETHLSADSFDYERGSGIIRENVDPDEPRNLQANWAEHELFFRSLLRWRNSESFGIAVGAEYSLERFGHGWGDSRTEMRMGDRGRIISGADSQLFGNRPGEVSPENAVSVGSGWTTHTVSLYAESDLTFLERYTALISGRVDKNSFTDYLFSPRIALITELNRRNHLKLIWQISNRMDTAEQLLIQDKNSKKGNSEELASYEVIYESLLTDRISLTLSGFYKEIDVIAWDNTALRTLPVGEHKLYGLEAESAFRWKNGKIGLNHSFIKQLDWDLAPGVQASGISYSDYNRDVGSGVTILGEGNNINNWSTHVSKIFGHYKIGDKLTLYGDAGVYWSFDGNKDGLDAAEKAAQGTSTETAVNAALAKINAQDVYDINFRMNLSISYELLDNLVLQAQMLNVTGEKYKRYRYDFGNFSAVPRNASFVEEPRVYAFSVNYKF